MTTSWRSNARNAMPVGGALMTVRYLIRLYRYLFRFDPATMSVGYGIPEHERALNLPDLANR